MARCSKEPDGKPGIFFQVVCYTEVFFSGILALKKVVNRFLVFYHKFFNDTFGR